MQGTGVTDGDKATAQAGLASRIGFWLGPLVAAIVLAIGAPEQLQSADALGSPAWLTLALLVWMAIWWVTEAIPIPVTSLLPMVLLPVLGVAPLRDVASAYMNPIIVLLLGGFIFAKAIEKWGLHERIALNIVKRFGSSPSSLLGGFIVASAGLSMWISNSATSIMMMPIAISLAAHLFVEEGQAKTVFTSALLLGIAYGCSIGGLGTPIGTPTNLIVIGYLEEQGGIEIAFAQWMMIGIPTVLMLVPVAWFVLTRWAFKLPASDAESVSEVIDRRLDRMGRISMPQKRTIGLFAFIALLWMSGPIYRDFTIATDAGPLQPFAGLSDHIVAILAVVLCFLVPSGSGDEKGSKLLDWNTAEEIPWGTLLLFGGGLTMAGVIRSTGLGAFFGDSLAVVASLPLPVLLLIVVSVVLMLTEVTSNVATASVVTPILGAMAIGAGIPVETIVVPLALAASCAFMLPMATGPNAVVFSTGEVTMKTMMGAGIRLNLLAALLISLIGLYLPPLVLGG